MIYHLRMAAPTTKTPRYLRFSGCVASAGNAPAGFLVAGLVATLVFVAGCSPTLDPVEPAAQDLVAPPLPAAFHRGMNLQPIGDYGGLLDEDQIEGALDALVELGVGHVAVIPSFFQRRLGDTEFYWEPSRLAVDEQTRAVVAAAHARGLAVLLKPHLWLAERTDGAWRGDIDPSPAEWPAWSQNYRAVLVEYARLADELGVAGISIGSELTAVATGHPEFWRRLAAALRQEYSGFLTYAANWDQEFEEVTWWDAVDFVGVDAFWPLLDAADEVLSAAVCRTRLSAVRQRLEAVAARFDRPVLLTEIGYKSAVGAAYQPWEWHDGQASDLDGQALIYRCIRDVFGTDPEPHIAGVYFWLWYTAPAWGGPGNSDFTPRGKPAEGVLAGWFSQR